MHDLVIRNARVCDGDGNASYVGSVAIQGESLSYVGEDRTVSGKTVVDADGLIIAPGFIDPHTHMDAQVCWDEKLSPSSWHGTTTSLIGNCGVGLAPASPSTRDALIADLQNVEGISERVLRTGVPWEWGSFAEYTQFIERRGIAGNIAMLAPLTPLRHFVMGEASLERAASEPERQKLVEVFEEALRAGAFGFSTDQMANHVGWQGRRLACQNADRSELDALCDALKRARTGLISISLNSLRQGVRYISEEDVETLRYLVARSGRPVTFLPLVAKTGDLDFGNETKRRLGDLVGRVFPQVSALPIVFLQTLHKPFKFSEFKTWHRALNRTVEEQLRLYVDPDFRRAAIAEQIGHERKIPWERTRVLSAKRADLIELNGRSIRDIATERGVEPMEAFLDIGVLDNLETIFEFASANLDDAVVARLLTDSSFILGISDAGAHIDQVCDSRYPTVLLGKWVRERGVMTVEHAVRKLTRDPASVLGLTDRGRLRPGLAADLVLFDPSTVNSEPPEFVADLPAGERRLVAKARGIAATFVRGVQVMKDGQMTGSLPGRVLRSRPSGGAV